MLPNFSFILFWYIYYSTKLYYQKYSSKAWRLYYEQIFENFKYGGGSCNKQLLALLALFQIYLLTWIWTKSWHCFCIISKKSSCNLNQTRYGQYVHFFYYYKQNWPLSGVLHNYFVWNWQHFGNRSLWYYFVIMSDGLSVREKWWQVYI